MNVIGIDVGGANLKAVFLAGSRTKPDARAIETPFEMWQRCDELDAALKMLIKAVDPEGVADAIAVTMTGELADCFVSKSEGVRHIVTAVLAVAGENPVSFYMTNGGWMRPEPLCGRRKDQPVSDNVIGQQWPRLAASNWHAMASFGSQFLNQKSGLMIDVGSTTTDIIPIVAGRPSPAGFDDYQRLLNQELIYAGVSRTPITGLIQSVDLPGGTLPLAREFFAAMDDALLWTGRVRSDQTSESFNDARGAGLACKVSGDDDIRTADGRPRTKDHAGQRLARMVCGDLAEVDRSIVDAIADAAIGRFEDLLIDGISRQIMSLRRMSSLQSKIGNMSEAPPDFDRIDVLIVGQGSDFVHQLLGRLFPRLRPVVFADCVGQRCSACGPAYAVAALLLNGAIEAGR